MVCCLWSMTGYIAKESGIRVLERHLHSHTHCSAIRSTQEMGSLGVRLLMNGCKENVVLIHSGILFSHKKNETLVFVKT